MTEKKKQKYVVITGFTNEGKPKFILDALTWTTDFNRVVKWDSLALCKSEVKALKEVYGVKGYIIPIEE